VSPRAVLSPGLWPWAAGLAAAGLLAGAHAFEAAGYAPCTLCLRQREVHWAALAVVGIWAALLALRRRRLSPLVCWLLATVFLYSAGLAAYHAGVEWKWWPGPSTCASGGAASVSLDDLSAVLSGERRVKPPCL
jgi:disulfide bond formation protein DsbB